MGYFDADIDRRNSGCLKWDSQHGYGQENGLLPFWIADMDLPTAPEIMHAIKRRCDHPVIGYSFAKPSVYEAIRGWWQRHHGWDIDSGWMLLSYSVMTSVSFALDALLEKEAKVLVFSPIYDPFFAVVERGGRTLVDCPLRCEDRYYSIDWERFEEELQNGVKAVLFCNPHNPVGRVWTQDEMQRVTDLCVRYGVFLLSDEIHADLGLTRAYTSAGKFPAIHDKLVVFTAISKTFNLAGMGSSCMFVPNAELKQRIDAQLKSRWLFAPDPLAFAAMEAAYSLCDAWYAELLDLLRENSAYVQTYMEQNMPNVPVTKHEGTFLMWLDFTIFGKTSSEISDILAKEYGIALGSGSRYGKQSDGFMRLNIGCPRQQLEQGLAQMKTFYDDYLSKAIRGEEKL